MRTIVPEEALDLLDGGQLGAPVAAALQRGRHRVLLELAVQVRQAQIQPPQPLPLHPQLHRRLLWCELDYIEHNRL